MKFQDISIGFAPNLVPLIKNGSKTFTYRVGSKYAFLNVGDTLFVRNSQTSKNFAEVEIIKKSVTTFGDLPIDTIGHEVYSSKSEQKDIFQRYYKRKISADEKVLILGFKVVTLFE